jgi:hypothetical protein
MTSGELLLAALSGVLTVFSTAMGWWLISLHNRHEKLRADHEELRVEVARDYMRKVDITAVITEFKSDIRDLFEGLGARLDRIEARQDRRQEQRS